MPTNPYTSPTEALDKYRNTPEKDHLIDGEKIAIKLFTEMSQKVPAYKDYLAKNNISTLSANCIEDLATVPAVDKDNYLRRYARKDLVWDGNIKGKSWIISATSGSTGEPFYFPRQDLQDDFYALSAEAYLIENFQIDKKSTLYINAFPMGIWIGGVFTYEAIRKVADHGYPLSIVTPGINKLEVIKAVKNLGNDFDQVIIGSYAPFLKDILDDGTDMGLDWRSYNLGFVFSAEAFTEEFRDFVKLKTGIKNELTGTLNHYGTVDLGTMAHETPLSILVRRLAIKNPTIFNELFGEINKLPTLAQYDPRLFYFEEDEGNLLCSSYSGIPLFKYDLKDHGGIRTKKQVYEVFEKHGISLDDEVVKAEIDKTVWNLPFVFVYERSDFSVSFFAFQIYPETLKKVLIAKEFNKKITSKFTMEVRYSEDGRQIFEVNVELRPGNQGDNELAELIATSIRDRLLIENSEYRKTSEENGLEAVTPKVIFWAYEDSKHFKPGGKQKWVKK